MHLRKILKTLSITVVLSTLATGANALQLFATGRNAPFLGGPGTESGVLYELDPTTGALIREVGDTGYEINGLAFDETTNTLYATTRSKDPNFPNGLLIINPETAEATEVGPGRMGQGATGSNNTDDAVTNITVNSSGQMYGWVEYNDYLGLVDKTAGTTSLLGTSGVSTFAYGLSFDNNDNLYLFNGDDSAYKVDTATGLATFYGPFPGAPYAHHGDFHPETNEYFGLKNNRFPDPQTIVVLTDNGAGFDLNRELATAPYLHTLAFIPTPPPPPGPDPIVPVVKPVPSVSWFALMAMGFGLTLLVFKRRFK